VGGCVPGRGRRGPRSGVLFLLGRAGALVRRRRSDGGHGPPRCGTRAVVTAPLWHWCGCLCGSWPGSRCWWCGGEGRDVGEGPQGARLWPGVPVRPGHDHAAAGHAGGLNPGRSWRAPGVVRSGIAGRVAARATAGAHDARHMINQPAQSLTLFPYERLPPSRCGTGAVAGRPGPGHHSPPPSPPRTRTPSGRLNPASHTINQNWHIAPKRLFRKTFK